MERPQSIKDRFPGEEFWTEQQYIARVQELEAEVQRLREAHQEAVALAVRYRDDLDEARAEIERLRSLVAWFQEVHGIDDALLPEFLGRLNAPAGKRA